MSSGLSLTVSIRIGSVGVRRLISRQVAIPPIPGILLSSSTASKCLFLIRASASSPVFASAITNPSAPSAALSPRLIAESSSTTRTLPSSWVIIAPYSISASQEKKYSRCDHYLLPTLSLGGSRLPSWLLIARSQCRRPGDSNRIPDKTARKSFLSLRQESAGRHY